MTVIKLSGIIIACLIGICILKLVKPEFAWLTVIITAIICFSFTAITNIQAIIESVNSLVAKTEASNYFSIMLKALGISYITIITSEICRSAGEELLSNISQTIGKFEILALCIPLANEIISIAKGFLE